MKVTIEGLSELNSLLKNVPTKVVKGVQKSLKTIALDLQGKSQRLAPVDLGDLQGSAFAVVEDANITQNSTGDRNPKSPRLEIPKAKSLEAIVGFTEPYALRQHEEITYNHPKGGQAKYLETPFKANRDKYIDYMGKAIKGAVET